MKADQKKYIKIAIYGVSAIAVIFGTSAIIKAVKNQQDSAKGKKEGTEVGSGKNDPVDKTVGTVGGKVTNVVKSIDLNYKMSYYEMLAYATFGTLPEAITKNVLGKLSNVPNIGVIEQRLKSPNGFWWYKVKLNTPLQGQNYGFVREDEVEINF